MSTNAPPAAIGVVARLVKICRALWTMYERQCEHEERFRRLEERVWELEQKQ